MVNIQKAAILEHNMTMCFGELVDLVVDHALHSRCQHTANLVLITELSCTR